MARLRDFAELVRALARAVGSRVTRHARRRKPRPKPSALHGRPGHRLDLLDWPAWPPMTGPTGTDATERPNLSGRISPNVSAGHRARVDRAGPGLPPPPVAAGRWGSRPCWPPPSGPMT